MEVCGKTLLCCTKAVAFLHPGRSLSFNCYLRNSVVILKKASLSTSNKYVRNFSDTLSNNDDGKSVRPKTTTPLFLAVQNYLDKVAVLDEFGSHTYRDILHNSIKLSQSLESLKKRSGSSSELSIGLLCDNNVLHIVGQFATWFSNGVSVSLGQKHMGNYMFRLNDAKCDAMISTSKDSNIKKLSEKLKIPLIKLTPEKHAVPAPEGTGDIWDMIQNSRNESRDLYADRIESNFYKNKTAVVLYKGHQIYGQQIGLKLSHGNLVARFESQEEIMGLNSSDVFLHAEPLILYPSLVDMVMLPLHIGATNVIHPNFFANEVWKELQGKFSDSFGYRVNQFMFGHKMIQDLLDSAAENKLGAKEDFHMYSSISVTNVSGWNKVAKDLSKSWFKVTKSSLEHTYGRPEYGNVLLSIESMHHFEPFSYAYELASNVEGRIYVKEIDNNSQNKPQEGELQLKGDVIFQGYMRETMDTAENFTEDGWYRTGDLAIYNQGLYHVMDPSIMEWNDGYHRVVASFVWHKLRSHPSVEQLEILRRPNHPPGKSVMAVVVLRYGCGLTLSDLQDFSAGHFKKSFLIPSTLVILESMPTNYQGKQDRRRLASMLWFDN